MYSNNGETGAYAGYRDLLLGIAGDTIRYGLDHDHAPQIDPHDFPAPLQEKRACFVTLQIGGQLRGCIGSLEAYRPLAVDVADNGYAAAFSDPRFPRLTRAELDQVVIHISILSPAEPVQFDSEEDLITRLRPGTDGLILEAEGHRGTFLPTVWESLPDPRDFLRHLKYKAGLPPDYWSNRIKVSRYTAEGVE